MRRQCGAFGRKPMQESAGTVFKSTDAKVLPDPLPYMTALAVPIID
jgi:hypothetical protein